MNRFPFNRLTVLFGLLFLTGCFGFGASDDVAEPEALPPASMITELTAKDDTEGTRVTLRANGSVAYRVFRLERPDRLLLTFPGVEWDVTIQPQKMDRALLSGLFPMDDTGDASRLEIMTKGTPEYEVQERPDGVEVLLLADRSVSQEVGPHLRDLDAVQ
ncbi:MAG: AMIN domain-containing protein, partial [Magnetococcales bacterium]|nr:AMIN domain-containing protein [Magnetococcales bacterium]